MKAKFMIWLSKNWEKNKDTNYPQTWYYMPPRWKWVWSAESQIERPIPHPVGFKARKIIEFLCGLIGGHELSKTEWGYGGGKYADRHCRWCDKVIKVPIESIYFQFKDSNTKSLMDEILTNTFKE